MEWSIRIMEYRTQEWWDATSAIAILADREGFCGDVSSEFVEKALQAAKIIVVIYRGKQSDIVNEYNLNGFALASIPEPNSIFLDLICSTVGHGSQIMRALQEHAIDRHISCIKLASLASVIMYYRKMGFVNCKEPFQNEHPRITQAAQAFIHTKFKSDQEAHNHKAFRRFLQLLIHLGLAADVDEYGASSSHVHVVQGYHMIWNSWADEEEDSEEEDEDEYNSSELSDLESSSDV